MINRRLAAVNILIVTICLTIVTFSAYLSVQSLFVREHSVIYSQLFENSYRNMKSVFDESERYSLKLCANDRLQELFRHHEEYSVQQMQEILNEINTERNYYSVSAYYVLNGVVSDFDGTPMGPFSTYDYGHDYYWQFRPSSMNVLRVSRVVYDFDDISLPIGVIQVDMSLTAIENIMYSFEEGGSNSSFLLLYDSEGKRLLPYYLSKQIVFDPDDTVTSLSDFSLNLNQQYVTVERTIINNGWKLYGYVTRSALFNDPNRINQKMIAAVVVLAAVAAVVTYFITNKITRPVLDLSDDVRHLAVNKKYDHLAVPPNATGEIRSLYESYNDLIDEVNASFREVQEVSRKEIDTQFMLLQAQINPHFLYNTLNTISWMAKNKQNEDIDKMVVSLVRMFRNSINNNSPLITLDGEIEHVSSYLNIMQYRYPNRYTVEYDIDEDTRDLYVTKQILQPLAENALTHGFLEADSHGKIIISSRIEDGYLVLEMRNTGADIDLEMVEKLLAEDPELAKKHYGIRNVNNRLVSYYGPESGLEYRCENGQTVVTMKLPLEKVEKGEKA